MDRHAHVVALAARQHGLIAVWQVIAAGGTRDTIKHMIRSGHWERITPMVLRRTGSPPSSGQAVLTAVLDAGRRAGLSHHPAAGWFDLNGFQLKPLHVIRLRNATSTPSSVLAGPSPDHPQGSTGDRALADPLRHCRPR
jgi:hypothetical protein